MNTNKTINRLSIMIIILALIASGLGVFWQGQGETTSFTSLRGETVEIYGRGLYHYDSVSYAAQAVAQDVVTLILGIPLLIGGLIWAGKGSRRGHLLLTGTLGYFLYTYTSYSFLSAYNQLFLIYVALFSLCLFAFILAMMHLNADEIASHISERFPRKGIVIFMMILAGFLLLAWLGRIVPGLIAGIAPFGLESYTTLVIQALDLGIIVPTSGLAAVLLWQSRPWGFALSAVVLVKGLTMGAALIAMIINQMLAGVSVSMVEMVMFSGIALAALIFSLIMFRNMNE